MADTDVGDPAPPESNENATRHVTRRRLVPKPQWVADAEQRVGEAIPLAPNLISAAKLLIITPALAFGLRQIEVLVVGPALILGLFALFAALDYLDGVVARARGLESQFGRVFDRFTDYPLLLTLSWFCLDLVPREALVAKLGIDALLLLLYVMGRGSTENRLRTGVSYATLLALLVVSQGWVPRLVNANSVEALLWVNVAFSGTVALYNLGVLQKRFIADALSAANLVCGIFSMIFASRGHPEFSLLLLVLGAGFDGFDGAAARRWGGTRFGVYSDDIADGVNYGIAPGVAVYFGLGGLEGTVIGVAFAVFTISRLVFFTLSKSEGGDPNYFAGVPSTVGGLITMCAIILYPERPAIVGLLVGIACAQMVAFGSQYRHVGRYLAVNRRALLLAPVYALLLLIGAKLWGYRISVFIVLVANLAYGLMPVVEAFRRVLVRAEDEP